MVSNSSKIAWGVTLLAAAGVWLIARSRRNSSSIPTLVNNNTDNMTTDPNLPRGYRNNNPLNIRISSNKWKGKLNPSGDSAFEQFVTMPYGYRAALVTMRNYISKYGLNTISQIISRWAPANENNTLGYIQHVCKIINERLDGNVTPDTVVAKDNRDLLTKMAYAMSIVENGDREYTRALGLPNMNIINEAWSLI